MQGEEKKERGYESRDAENKNDRLKARDSPKEIERGRESDRKIAGLFQISFLISESKLGSERSFR